MKNNYINNGLAIASLLTSVAAYQLWKFVYDDFCYQALGVSLLLLFCLVARLGEKVFWVYKTSLIGVGICLYNMFDEWFLNPLHADVNEYICASLIVFFIFTPEIFIFLRWIKDVIDHSYRKILIHHTIKTLINGSKGRNGRL